MSDHTGAIIWKAEYKAWGECKAEKAKSNFFENSEIISNNIRFQGQYFDQETGLHYNRYLYYSPFVGRFVSRDPIGLNGGFNVFKYASNPISWIDPYGLKNLYRSMSMEEYNSLRRTGRWTTKPGAMDGKWMAESYATAKVWGNTMGHGGCEFMIVQVNVPDKIADQMHIDGMLDGIGAARYATLDQLNNHSKIAWVKKEKAIESQCKFK